MRSPWLRRLIVALVLSLPLTDFSLVLSLLPALRFPGWQWALIGCAARLCCGAPGRFTGRHCAARGTARPHCVAQAVAEGGDNAAEKVREASDAIARLVRS